MGNTKPADKETAIETTNNQPLSADDVKNILVGLLPDMLTSALAQMLPAAMAEEFEKSPPQIDAEHLADLLRQNLTGVIKEVMPDILPDMLAAQLPGALADERNAQAAGAEGDAEAKAKADADAREAAAAVAKQRAAEQEKADAHAAKAAAKHREEARKEAAGAYAEAITARELGEAAKPADGACVIRFSDGQTFYTGIAPIAATPDRFISDGGAAVYDKAIAFDATAAQSKLTEAWLIDGEGGATRCVLGSALMVGGGHDALIPASHLLFRPERAQPST